MSLTNEQIQAILDGAPEGATHIDIEGDYWVMQETQAQFWCDKFEWSYAEPQEPLHSLSDLREIITLRQRVQGLESDWNSEHYHRRAVDDEDERLKDQQSKVAAQAVEGFAHKFKGDDSEWVTYHAFRSAAYQYASDLREQNDV